MKRNKKLLLLFLCSSVTPVHEIVIIFIKTDDAHKIRILSHTIFNTFKKCNRGRDGNIVKNDGGGEMVVVFTITEINYLLVSLFFDLVPTILYLYMCICSIKFFDCAICLVSGLATKSAMPSLKVIHHILEGAHQAELFSNQIFSLNSVLQSVLAIILFEFFLKLGTLLQFFVIYVYII